MGSWARLVQLHGPPDRVCSSCVAGYGAVCVVVVELEQCGLLRNAS